MPTPPSRGSVSSPYGMRVNPNDGVYRMHYGEDTLGPGNYAPATGTVVYAGFDNTGTGLGWAVGVREDADPAVIWWVAHHGSKTGKQSPLRVGVGSRTVEGLTYLGPKGDSGAAQGVHAHTERRRGGVARPGSGTATDPRLHYIQIATKPQDKDDDMRFTVIDTNPTLGKTDTYTSPEGVVYARGTWAMQAGSLFVIASSSEQLDAWANHLGISRSALESSATRVSAFSFYQTQQSFLADSRAQLEAMKNIEFQHVPVDVGQIAAAVEGALSDDLRAILDKLETVDEATLATFGLKRI